VKRILFVSSTAIGGSGRSQRELSAQLRNHGLQTLMLVDDGRGGRVQRFLHEQLWDASIRFHDTTVLGSASQRLRSLPGRHARQDESRAGDVRISMAPENAFPELAMDFKPDVVVGSSIDRPAWRAVRRTCADLQIPAVLYLREAEALGHLEAPPHHELVIANSRTLQRAAKVRGTNALFIPSVTDTSSTRCVTSRDAIMLINPIETHGLKLIPELASTFPTTPFILQQSWPLTGAQRDAVDTVLRGNPNVTFRSIAEPAAIYRDIGLLLAPHQIDNRPRVVLEAQANGIPVIATNQPGLVEAVGPGGVCLPRNANSIQWTDAIAEIWTNPARYRELEGAARNHATRPEVDPGTVAAAFVGALEMLHNKVRL
jgi:glycosyltransferase involved in cell wall biosynthesis